MELEVLQSGFSACRLKSLSGLPQGGIYFLAQTDQEISLICEAGREPSDAPKVKTGYRGFRIVGQLDFSLVGILAKISAVLAEGEIPILALSTYDTDYVMVDEVHFEKALGLLTKQGYTVRGN